MSNYHWGHRWDITAGLLVALLAGCGVEDEGAWSSPGAPQQNVSDVVPEPAPEPIPVEPGGAVLTTRAPADEGISCTLPSSSGVQVEPQSGGGDQISRDTLCLPPAFEASPGLCWQVRGFEARAAAIAACWAEAQKDLERQGTRILGREWRQAALPFLPSIWSRSSEEIAALAHQLTAGLAHILTGGASNAAPGSPLCVPLAAGLSAAQAVALAEKDIALLVKSTQRDVAAVEAALRRGVDAQVTKDLHLHLRVKLIEQPAPLTPEGTCAFHAEQQ